MAIDPTLLVNQSATAGTADNAAMDDAAPSGTNSAPATSNTQIIPVTASKLPPGPRADTAALAESLRQQNGLAKFSSYTYQISLYMLTAEAYNAFVVDDTLKPEQGGYYIVAQSGGLNSTESRGITYTNQSGQSYGSDYFIDDLSLETFMIARDGQRTATVNSSCNFKIYEPVGFAFLTRLSELSERINSSSNITKSKTSRPTLYQQHYVLGIRFYGYDVNGQLVKAADLSQPNSVFKGDSSAVYERFLPIIISKMDFKLSNRETVYNVSANVVSVAVAFGQKYGTIQEGFSVRGSSVGQMLTGDTADNSTASGTLTGELNAYNYRLVSQQKIKNVIQYSIEWLSDDIRTSRINDSEEIKETTPSSTAQTQNQVNVRTASQNSSIATKVREMLIPNGTSIVSAIDNIISKSDYISKHLDVINDQRIETSAQKNTPVSELKWFSIKPVVKVIGRDDVTNDWAYSITYQIGNYYIPYLTTTYRAARGKTPYYGAFKKYEYYYTGKNTEIISFDQEYNNLYYTVNLNSVNQSNFNSGDAEGSYTPAHYRSSVADNKSLGKIRGGSGINESVRASLYSLADQAQATIKILGDPDFLSQNIGTGSSQNVSTSFTSYYGREGSLNPYGGQVFIEIYFKGADDYGSDGLLETYDVEFYPSNVRRSLARRATRGTVYRLNKVDSNFNDGTFTQTLELTLIAPGQLAYNDDNVAFSDETNPRESNTTTRAVTAPINADTRQVPLYYDASPDELAQQEQISTAPNRSSVLPLTSNADPEAVGPNGITVIPDDALPSGPAAITTVYSSDDDGRVINF